MFLKYYAFIIYKNTFFINVFSIKPKLKITLTNLQQTSPLSFTKLYFVSFAYSELIELFYFVLSAIITGIVLYYKGNKRLSLDKTNKHK